MKTMDELMTESLTVLDKIRNQVESPAYDKLDLIRAAVTLEKLKKIHADISNYLNQNL